MSITRRPDVFVSATSGDLGHIRQLAKQALLSIGCHPVEQTNFPPDYRSVEDMLRARISECDAVLHIVGVRYGMEPDPESLPAGASRESYTQMEARLARELAKKLYLFYCPDDFPFGTFTPEPEEKAALQATYRERIARDKQLQTIIHSETEAELRVRELQTKLEALQSAVSSLEDTVSSTNRGNKKLLILSAFGLVTLLGVGSLVVWQLQKSRNQEHDTLRIEQKLDEALTSFSRERELLSKVLDATLRKNAELENLPPEARFAAALSEIAGQENIPVSQLESTLDIYAAKVKALGDSADSLDRVLVAQKERQFDRAVKIADASLDTLRQEDAALAASEKSLSKVTKEIQEQRKQNQQNRHALLMAKGRSLEAQSLFEPAAAAFAEAEELANADTDPEAWTAARSARIQNLREAGIAAAPEHGNILLREAAALAEDFLKTFPQDRNPTAWSEAQHRLGSVMSDLGVRLPGDAGAQALREAVASFRRALSVRGAAEFPEERAKTLNNLGNALQNLGARLPPEEGLPILREARESLEESLTVLTKDRHPIYWAGVMQNLAGVLQDLGAREEGGDGLTHLEAAKAAFEDSLTVITKEKNPQHWAQTMSNLGWTLQDLGARKTGEEAIALLNSSRETYLAALTVLTEKDLPQYWAGTQNNLGNVLRVLSENQPGPEGAQSLLDSIQAYERALTIHTRTELPQPWAATEHNLGTSLTLLADRLTGPKAIEALNYACESFEGALQVRTKDAFPFDWEASQTRLTLARINLGLKLISNGDTDLAIAHFRRFMEDPAEAGVGKNFRAHTEDAFLELDRRGLTHPDLPRVKKALGLASGGDE